MRIEWLLAIGSMAVGLILWFIGWQFGPPGILPISLFLGSIIPASLIVIDLSRRLLPTTLAKTVLIGISTIDVIVLIAIITLQIMDTAQTFVFLAATTVAIWGTVTLGIGIALIILFQTFQLVTSYNRVASGRTKAIGAILVGVGGLGLVLPLQFINLTDGWPVVALPAIIVGVMGLRRLDSSL